MRTWTDGGAVSLLNVGTRTSAAAVEWRRIVTQASALLCAASALARCGALRPRRPRGPASVHCKINKPDINFDAIKSAGFMPAESVEKWSRRMAIESKSTSSAMDRQKKGGKVQDENG